LGLPESAPALVDPLDDPELSGREPLAPPEEAVPDAEEPVDPEEPPPELVACAPLADLPLVPPPASSPPAPPPEGPEQAPTLPAAARTSHDNTREMGSDDAPFMRIPRGGSGAPTARPSWFHTRVWLVCTSNGPPRGGIGVPSRSGRQVVTYLTVTGRLSFTQRTSSRPCVSAWDQASRSRPRSRSSTHWGSPLEQIRHFNEYHGKMRDPNGLRCRGSRWTRPCSSILS
jgi:hypothetical protein